MGGWDKHNTKFSCGAFCKAKYEIRRRRKRGRDGNSFSPHPFFFPPRPSVQFGARSAANLVGQIPESQILVDGAGFEPATSSV